jgi:predicted 2-oxoglutarate/Fe(II)-dependent dioxygenase YbiX
MIENETKRDVPLTSIKQLENIRLNEKFCSIVHTDILSSKQCEAINKEIIPELWTDVNAKADIIKNIKRQPLPINTDGWPLTYILSGLKEADEEKFKFDLRGFMDNDAPTLWQFSKGSSYDWHIDIGNNFPTRKLSFIVQLSDPKDYEGGDIEFLNSKTDKEALRQQGKLIIFPAFLSHKITKVTKGVRHAIVGWVHGPTFF